jgi:hypothetical protein
MERMVPEADDIAGKAYEKFSVEARRKFNQVTGLFLKKAVNDGDRADYKKMLDDNGEEAKRNGMTPEILQELLHSDE